MKFKDELFSPYLFLIGFIIFCIIGLFGRYYFSEYYVPSVSFYTFFYVILISLVFVIGCKIKFNINQNILIGTIILLTILFTFKRYGYFSILLCLLGLLILYMIKKNIFMKYYIHIFITGILLCIVNIVFLGKIPLTNPTIRELSITPLFFLGYVFMFISNNIGIIKEKNRNKMIFPIICLVIFVLYGFRTYVILLIISTMSTLYLTGNRQKSIYFGIVGVILTLILGYITIMLLPQNWKLNPFELVWYRITFTFDVFDKICFTTGAKIFGTYSMLTETTTGYIISEKILNYSHNITSTIFGPPILDGGVLEVILFTLLTSISLFILYEEVKTRSFLIPYYSFILSIYVVSIEISPYPLIILLIPLSLYISRINSI